MNTFLFSAKEILQISDSSSEYSHKKSQSAPPSRNRAEGGALNNHYPLENQVGGL